ncbi:KpsF/GutQ family sugar-phosphate isomerase [Hippea maritima]|uniref:KpsF/GutQ family protein n=1 Tax=Hippea maritima (strain ATCC 700847 / DSM 10411 / MH2) TaxID=760142 RepID=F2LUG7_HIPMA|nr:KpsF/GutQ family sugar-phosphate isomerase [Hippea maritima]AEA33493.1 KpsF/GutQ family protein [Hippea maritima DSM 10411]
MNKVLNAIKRAVDIEANSIISLSKRIDSSFLEAVELIDGCEGRVIFSGIGKSGLVAKKISSTFSSIGIPSMFVHPAEAAHGDLGMIRKDDVAILLSNSGSTPEVLFLLPMLKRFGLKIISIVGNVNSELAKRSDVVLDSSVEQEATSVSLVPTSSTTTALVIGDALAAGLIVKRDFKEEDFAFLHPGGAIGKKLLVRVEDLMHSGGDVPVVGKDESFEKLIYEISSKRLGMTTVVNDKGELIGVITDGDLRRAIEKYKDSLFKIKAKDIMNKNPKTIDRFSLAAKAANIMESYSITSLVVIEDNGRIEGVIHMHDILKAGVL